MLANTDGFAQIKFGVKGGVNLTDLSFDELLYESDAGKSFFVGPVAKISLPIKQFVVELGALYDYRSAKVISTDLVGAPMYKSTLEQKQIRYWIKNKLHIGAKANYEIIQRNFISTFQRIP